MDLGSCSLVFRWVMTHRVRTTALPLLKTLMIALSRAKISKCKWIRKTVYLNLYIHGNTVKRYGFQLHNHFYLQFMNRKAPLLKLDKWYNRLTGMVNFDKVAWVKEKGEGLMKGSIAYMLFPVFSLFLRILRMYMKYNHICLPQ